MMLSGREPDQALRYCRHDYPEGSSWDPQLRFLLTVSGPRGEQLEYRWRAVTRMVQGEGNLFQQDEVEFLEVTAHIHAGSWPMLQHIQPLLDWMSQRQGESPSRYTVVTALREMGARANPDRLVWSPDGTVSRVPEDFADFPATSID